MSYSARTVLLCAALGMSPLWGQEPSEDPVDSGIVEQAERRLMQIDVTVRGPADVLSALAESDFKVGVGRNDIEEFVLDRVCIDDTTPGSELADPQIATAAPRLRTLLFFDQTHLTRGGRQRSIELARGLIEELTRGGRSELMIVSAGRRLRVAAEWSSDPGVLLAALDEIDEDPQQMLVWADQEETRVTRMMTAIDRMAELIQNEVRDYNRREREKSRVAADSGGGLTSTAQSVVQSNFSPFRKTSEEYRLNHRAAQRAALIVARELSREETTKTSQGLKLFSIALQYLEGHAPPKAVVYFADTMRANPGDFYVDLVREADRSMGLFAAQSDERIDVTVFSDNYVTEFQRAIDLATEKGVRLYTVQGRGLAPQALSRTRVDTAALATMNPLSGRARFDDAENALVGLARETGGKSFLGAADATRIASRILDDLACLFVLSFHVPDLQEDRRTPVWIEVDRPGIELRYRPKLIALSRKERDRERLESAFWNASRSRDSARVLVVPTGFEKGKYTVLVQFAIPGSPLTAGDWDMGLTALVGENRTREASGRVAINQPGLPLVFEAEMKLRPGDFTITAVGRNNEHGELISTRIDGSLPDPDDREPFVASIVMLQRAHGAFVRGETARTEGSLAHGDAHWLRPDRPVGILALVCGSRGAAAVTAARILQGASEVSFDGVELDFEQERCGLLVDSIDADVLTSGRFTYAVDLNRGAESVAQTVRDFLVVSEEEISLARRDRDE